MLNHECFLGRILNPSGISGFSSLLIIQGPTFPIQESIKASLSCIPAKEPLGKTVVGNIWAFGRG